MNKKAIGWVIFLLISGSIIIPLILSEPDSQSKISIIASTLSAVASLCTLWLAYLIYNKFAIDKTIIEKRTDEVFKLLEKLEVIQFFFSVENKLFVYHPLRMDEQVLSEIEKYYSYVIVFNNKYYYSYLNDFLVFSRNRFLPKEIAQKINLIELQNIRKVQESEISEMVHLITTQFYRHKTDEQFAGEWKKDSLFTNEIDLFNFISLWDELIEVIKEWILRNTDEKLDLNF